MIDGFWLVTKLNKIFQNPEKAKRAESQILPILGFIEISPAEVWQGLESISWGHVHLWASTVDPASRANSAEVQNCANCALAQGEAKDGWLQCQIFPGKAVSANGWCSVWAPKA